jgi:outer membrane protein OmpA-like peptidoglycan-associated protein
MKNYCAILCIVLMLLGGKIFSQVQNKGWVLSIAYSNINNGDEKFMEQSFSNFNTFEYPNTLSAENLISSRFSIQFSGIYNQFQPKIDPTNRASSTSNQTYLSGDVKINYKLTNGLGKKGWLDPFITSGIGYSKLDKLGDAKYSGGLGSNFWVKPNWGIQINSNFHKGFEAQNSFIFTHSIGLILKINNKKQKVSQHKNSQSNEAIENIASNEKKVEKKSKKEKIEKTVFQYETPEPVITVSEINKEIKQLETPIEVNQTDSKIENSVPEQTLVELTPKQVTSSSLEVDKIKISSEKDVTKTIEKVVILEDSFEVEPDVDKTKEVSNDINQESFPNASTTVINTIEKEQSKINPTPQIDTVKETESTILNEESTRLSHSNILKISTVYFDLNQSKVLDNEKSKIHMIIYILDKNPNSKILIEGHTTQKGENDAIKLSQSRALAVKQYLINKGVDAAKIEIKSLGSSEPLIQKGTETETKLNCRAKIVLYQY